VAPAHPSGPPAPDRYHPHRSAVPGRWTTSTAGPYAPARDAADILRFTTDTAIWFSNNQSERDLRPTKLQQKISGTWRTLQGLADFAALRSYLSTATKHGMDLLDVLQQLFTTGPWLPPDPVMTSS